MNTFETVPYSRIPQRNLPYPSPQDDRPEIRSTGTSNQTGSYISSFISFAFAVAALGIAIKALVVAQGNVGGISTIEEELSSFRSICTSDSDCSNATLGNPCLDAFCVEGACVTQLGTGFECSFSAECTFGFCNSLCECQSASGIEIGSYTPQYKDAFSPKKFLDYSTIFEDQAYYKDFGDFVDLDITARFSSFAGETPTSIRFDFSLPFPSDTISFNGTGFFSVSQQGGLYSDNPSTLVSSSGFIFLTSNETFAEVIGPISNPSFTGPTIQTIYRVDIRFFYAKSTV